MPFLFARGKTNFRLSRSFSERRMGERKSRLQRLFDGDDYLTLLRFQFKTGTIPGEEA